MALVGTELLLVTPIGPLGTVSPVSEQVTTAQIAALAAIPANFQTYFLAWFATLPTSLPATPGQPWNNGGTFALS